MKIDSKRLRKVFKMYRQTYCHTPEDINFENMWRNVEVILNVA